MAQHIGHEAPINVNGGEFTLGPGLQPALRMDSKQLSDYRVKLNAQRLDSLSPAAGLHLARQLEHIYSDVLREEFPPQSAFELFPLDNSVPVGARNHTVRRLSQAGEPKVYRGNSRDIPAVSVGQEEETFPVRHYVIGLEFDVLDLESANFANTQLRQELQIAAQETMMEFANHKTWFGDDENGIYGIFNYPWLPKQILPLGALQATNAEAFLAQMNQAANFAHEESKTVYSPDTMVVSPRVMRYMSTTYRGTGTDSNLLELFRKSNPRIKSVEEAWELQGSGPGDTDGILFYRRTRRAVANVLVRPFTMLPMQQQGLGYQIPCLMSHGGVVQRDVLNNLLCFIEAE
jgi:hypothetical protein